MHLKLVFLMNIIIIKQTENRMYYIWDINKVVKFSSK